MNAYITGSYAYGSPTEKSDIDLVLLLSGDDYNFLWEKKDKGDRLAYSMLNLVVFNADDEQDLARYYRWKVAHDNLIKLHDNGKVVVTKERATEEFRKYDAEKSYNKKVG